MKVFDRCSLVNVKSGTTLATAGRRSESVFVIKHGAVRLKVSGGKKDTGQKANVVGVLQLNAYSPVSHDPVLRTGRRFVVWGAERLEHFVQ
jgi:hypothetical protein